MDPPYSIPGIPLLEPTTSSIASGDCLSLVGVVLRVNHYHIEFTFPPNDPDPITDPTLLSKVLIHKYGPEAYPVNQNQDGQIQISGQITGGNNISNRDVSLRVYDPQDRSVYVPIQDPYTTPDNSGAPAMLSLNGAPGSGQPTITVQTDETGNFIAVLMLPNDAKAGDNYQIEASLDNFATIDSQSGTITAWKRMYVETDEMFKRGAFVKGDTNENAPGAVQLHVADKEQFKNCSKVRIIHAPYIDGSDNNFVFYYEDRNITNNRPSDGSSKGGFIQFVSGETLNYPYTKDLSPDAQDLEYLADAVGCIQGTNPVGTYHVNEALVEAAYKLSFVEFKPASQTINWAPFKEKVTGTDLEAKQIAYKWFQNSTRDPQPGNPFHQIADSNHMHVIYASALNFTTDYGTTVVTQDSDYSWIWYDNIKAVDGSSNADAVAKEILVHELAHQWKVNPGSGGHCNQKMSAPNNPNLFCTMSTDLAQNNNTAKNQRKDGIVGFHFVSKTDSEYFTIRWKQDPVPQQ